MSNLQATLKKDRIISLDVLRGVAILGIIVMNIISFSMPAAAYSNPNAFGDLTGINYWIWLIGYVLVSEKFMTLFSIMFGAGIILFNMRGDEQIKPAKLHYKRNFFLLIFGLIHAYVIWYGDILVAYALCGFLAYVFRKLKVKTLFIVGSAFFVVPPLLYLFSYSTVSYWPPESVEQSMQFWKPSADALSQEIANMQGSWLDQSKVRVPMAIMLEVNVFLMQIFWKVTGLMLFGMALYKAGVLSAARSKGFYLRMLIIGFSLGLFIVISGVNYNIANDFEFTKAMFIGTIYNYIGSLGVALGYIALIMLMVRSTFFSCFINMMATVGRMAFTNYILTSIIAFILFTGLGFGLFGQIDRTIQLVIVVAMWIVLITFSNIWLKHYTFGPLEWLWRSLTYGKFQSFKRKD